MLARSTNDPVAAQYEGVAVTIAIIDYGAGNLVSVKKSFDFLGRKSFITSEPAAVRAATKIVLPGVGHFSATEMLGRSGLRDAIANGIQAEIPFLGICVGMQWMFERSEEAPSTPGLGLLAGKCEHFPAEVKSPHVGWNSLQIKQSSRLFRDVTSGVFVYFTHSFQAPVTEDTVACCEYGRKFAAAVERRNCFGVQFHPEKSGESGLKILRNFCAL